MHKMYSSFIGKLILNNIIGLKKNGLDNYILGNFSLTKL